ncbi:MAG: CDP-diacylglycerol--glycerol-3-phosphate 3-phosphatidyltransferase [Clostridia bacterium]|nr:CDP-diacylglycerol--glycerol-3-phosphate 3-phosphatidyltransferase [Clostridia bacterium]
MNLPNTITMIRIALVPVFMIVALSGIPYASFIATVIFTIASITDGLDGYIARKYNLVTNFGKFVDPLADKLLVTSALLIFVEMGIMPAWAVMLVISRDLIISSLRMLAAARGRVIQAVFSGKLKTTVHIICIILLMLNILPASIQTVAVWVMVIMSVYSCIDYMAKNIDILKDDIIDGGKK